MASFFLCPNGRILAEGIDNGKGFVYSKTIVK